MKLTEKDFEFIKRRTNLSKEEIVNLQKQLRNLNQVIGTPLASNKEREIKLPKGLRLKSGVSFKKYFITDERGMALIFEADDEAVVLPHEMCMARISICMSA